MNSEAGKLSNRLGTSTFGTRLSAELPKHNLLKLVVTVAAAEFENRHMPILANRSPRKLCRIVVAN